MLLELSGGGILTEYYSATQYCNVIFSQKADVHFYLPLSLFSYVSCNQLHGSCVFRTILPGLVEPA